MRRTLLALGILGSVVLGATAYWRRHPRVGTAWVNRVVDPWLVRQGVIDKSEGELGLIEHVGRKSGIVRISPVHPVRTANGFRIVVPLGLESQWAHNVLTAGRCRLQLGDVVYELDEPMLVSPMLVDDIAPVLRQLMARLGFQYLELHRFAEAPGTRLVPLETVPEMEPDLVPV